VVSRHTLQTQLHATACDSVTAAACACATMLCALCLWLTCNVLSLHLLIVFATQRFHVSMLGPFFAAKLNLDCIVMKYVPHWAPTLSLRLLHGCKVTKD
jgi:hypothetical protein